MRPALAYPSVSVFGRTAPRRPCLRLAVALVVALGVVLLAGSCAPHVPDRHQRIEVFVGGPVSGATVLLWWVDGDGHPLRKDGTRHGNAALNSETAVASGTTDDRGAAVIENAGFVYGDLVLMAYGGSYVEPWLLPEGTPREEAPDAAIVTLPSSASELALWSAVVDYIPPDGPEPAPFVISPLTTLAWAMAERSMGGLSGSASGEALWHAAVRDTYALLGEHFGSVDLTRGPLPDWMPGMPGEPTMPATYTGDEQARHGLVLAAFAALAQQMARLVNEDGMGQFQALGLLALLLDDVSDPVGLLDGNGASGPLAAGLCELPDECAGQDDGYVEDGACRSPCALDSNTLRADLASALAFEFLGSPVDRTGFTLQDVRALAESLRTGQTPALFGYDAPVIELGGSRPIVRALPTSVYDELDDAIEFDEWGVPVHTTGDSRVELGAVGSDEGTCPVVHKFVHRMDDPDDNPIRWELDVVDRRGARIDPEGGMYRLRLRQPDSGEPGEPDENDGIWLTDWLPANPIGSVENGVRYEVVLLRSKVPALGSVSGDIELELRGEDELGLETLPVRYCWHHVPLAPPLQVRNVAEAVGPGSLHEANLEPGNNLAPLLNGVPLEQGRSVMDLEIVNGTAEPVYVTFAIEQGLTTFTKSWQKTNAFLFEAGASDCLDDGECSLGFPPDRRTVVVTDEAGVIEELVSGLLVQDLTTGQRIDPCQGCDRDEYRIEPRITLGNPRVYRVRLVVTNLGALSPQPMGASLGPFADISLDPEVLPIPITGLTFGRLRHCLAVMDEEHCLEEDVYQHYLSLSTAALSLVGGVHLLARSSALSELPAIMLPAQPAVLGAPVGISTYQWSTTEEPLPPLQPEMSHP